MTVGDLKKLLEGVDDSVLVLIPATNPFDGRFYSPCKESGLSEICRVEDDIDEEDIAEMELLNKSLPEEPAFLMLPTGFDTELSSNYELN